MGLFGSIVKAFLGDSDEELAQKASDPAIDLDELKDIYVSAASKCGSTMIDSAVATNPHCPDEIRDELVTFYVGNYSFNYDLASSANTPSYVLNCLVNLYGDSDDKDFASIVRAAKENPNFSA